MGQGGLYVLVLLGLLMVASERNKGGGTRCWVKGKEVTLRPQQCPAEFDGADAKFCCRLCYGANCCQPRRARVNLARCPRETRQTVADQDYTAASDRMTAPPPEPLDWIYLVLVFALFTIAIVVSCFCCKEFWRTCYPVCKEDGVQGTRARGNSQSSRVSSSDIVPDHLPRPFSVLQEDPPPYSVAVSQGTHDLPPPHPGSPVVAFRRSRSHGQDDTVVILPRLGAPPQEAASASAPAAVLPRDAVTDSASEATGLPEAAADGSAPDPTE